MANKNSRLTRLKAYAASYLAFWMLFNVPQLRAAILDTVQHYLSAPANPSELGASSYTGPAASIGQPEEQRLSRPGPRTLGDVAFTPLAALKSTKLESYDVLMPVALLLMLGAVVAPAVAVIGRLRRRCTPTAERSGQELRREPRKRTRLRPGFLLDSNGRKLSACSVLDRSEHGARIRVERAVPQMAEVRFQDEGAGITYKAQVAWARGQEIGLALQPRDEPEAEPDLLLISGRKATRKSASAEIADPNAQPDPRWHLELWDPASGKAVFNASYMELHELLQSTRPFLENNPRPVPKVKAPTLIDEEELAKLEEIGAELV